VSQFKVQIKYVTSAHWWYAADDLCQRLSEANDLAETMRAKGYNTRIVYCADDSCDCKIE
jgi:hypothetical protein